MSDAYRAAAASSGLLQASQLKVNSQTEKYTDLLAKQKVSLRDMVKNQSRMREVYRDQLRLQRMTVTSRGTDKFGREISDITVPTNVTRELDTIGNRLKFIRTMTASASTQMINWGKNVQWAGRQLTVGLTMPMAMFAAAAGKMAYDVDKQLTRIAKVYDTTLGNEALSIDKAKELAQVRKDSYQLGVNMAKQYGAAINNVLDVEAKLAATGQTGQKLLEGTAETVRIATLGEVDFTQATEMTVALQTAFKDTIKTSEDLTQAFDYMNYIENTTSLSIQDIAEATPRAASALASLGVSVQEMTVLLVAMREAGVDAAEGANALKSASTRILNVVPEAEAKFQGKLMGFSTVQDIADKAGGNLYEFLQLLARATRGMSDLDKQKGIAKLFGTYQYNRLNAALRGVTDSMFGMGEQSSQTSKAVAALEMSASDLAAVSAGEIAKKMASASGQWDSAWQQFKISMAKAGQDMLPIGTQIVDILRSILEAGMLVTDSIPGWLKPILKWFVAITALAGPTIMLIGLLGNLVGWGMKIIGLGSKWTVLNRAQQAAKIQADQTSVAYVKEAEAVRILTAELNSLAMAQGYSMGVARKAELAAQGAASTIGARAGTLGGTGLSGAVAAGAGGGRGKTANQIASALGLPMTAGPVSTIGGVTKSIGKNNREYFNAGGKFASKEQIADYKRLEALQKKIQASEAQTTLSRAKGATATLATADAAEENAKHLNSGQKAAGAMQLALVGSMVTSGGLQKTLIGATTALFAFSAAQQTGLTGLIAKQWKSTGTGIARHQGRSMKAMSIMTKGAKAFGAALLGPWGLAAAAAVGVGYLIYKNQQKGQEQQEALNRSTSVWADTLGLVEKKYKAIDLSINKYKDTSTTTKEIAESLITSDDGKALVEAMKDADSIEQGRIAVEQYVRILRELNGTAEDAQRGVEALFIAAGDNVVTAGEKAAELSAKVGTNAVNAYVELFDNQINALFAASGDEWGERTKGISDMLITGIEGAQTWAQREQILLNFQSTLDNQAGDNWADVMLKQADMFLKPRLEETLNSINFDQGKMQEFFSTFRALQEGGPKAIGFDPKDNLTASEMMAEKFSISAMHAQTLTEAAGLQGFTLDKVTQQQEKLVKEVAKELGIRGKILTMEQLIASEEWQRITTTRENVRMRVGAIQREAQERAKLMPGFLKGVHEQGQLERINSRLRAAGLDEVSSIYSKIDWAQLNIIEKEKRQTSETNRHKRALEAALKVWNEFRKGGIVDATKTAWSNTTSAVAEMASSQLQAQQQAEADALDTATDREGKALEKRADHWDRFYDNAIDRANAYYDKRIEGINNIIEREEAANDTRQRIFEAEQTRLQRMAENANRTIDFNMALNEGKLDEAAKIMNDAAATTASSQMEDEQKRADYELELRRASLEKQIELLEKQRDRKVKSLEDAREAKQRAIDNAREVAEAQADIQKKALAAQHEREKIAQQRGLDLLRAFIPRNKKELLEYMKELDARYNTFGGNLKDRASEWGNFIGKEQNHQLQIAANNMKTEVNWAGAGFDAAGGMMKGMADAMGFDNVAQLRDWLGLEMSKKRNELPTNGINPSINKPRGPGSFHTGGEIGRDVGGRTGFAGSMSRQETLINAQRGEYMVKKSAVNKYGTDFLDRVNDGRFGIGGPSGQMGMMGAMIPFMARAMYGSLFGAFSGAVQKKAALDKAKGFFGAASAGKYGGTNFSEEQLKNAGIIADVGSNMGMSQRDIVIGLMTAMQESMLRNVQYGDRDSLGLFQQRPSQGWGTPEQVTNPRYAAGKFFSALRGVEGRNSMPLTLAAQAVQRSAYPLAYAKWEDEARAMVAAMSKGASPGGTSGYLPGAGGRHRPVTGGSLTQGLHPNNAVDIGVPTGTGVYAVADGRVSGSYDIPGYESRQPDGGNGYRSYGRVITVDHGGFSTLYAHLSRRGVSKGQAVRGGARMGFSGDTGNSSGPHLHFEAHGASPYAFLRKGGELRWDNTPAMLHRGETVLTAPLTRQFKENVASGGGNSYSVNLDLRGAYIKEDVDIKSAVKEAINEIETKVGRKRKVG